MAGRVSGLVLRFALCYAALLGVAALLPVYAWIERALVWLVDSTLASGPGAVRSLALGAGAVPAYRYEVELGGVYRSLGGPMHAHGFVPLVAIAAALVTPDLSRTGRALAALAGALVGGLIALGMLMLDLQGWEQAAFPGARGPYCRAIALFDGLHRTAAGGLLPLVLWSFAVWALTRRAAPPP